MRTLKRVRILAAVMFLATCCTLTGFAAGFMYGTGSPAMSILIPPVAITPPATAAATGLDNISKALAMQPKQNYRDGYNCVDFAWDAMRTLEWKGQAAAIVRLDYGDNTSHAILLVPTTDKGYQFIESQNNDIIKPQIGSIYGGKVITGMSILEFDWVPFDIFLLDPNYGVDNATAK